MGDAGCGRRVGMALDVRDDSIVKSIMGMSEEDRKYHESYAVKAGCKVSYSSKLYD